VKHLIIALFALFAINLTANAQLAKLTVAVTESFEYEKATVKPLADRQPLGQPILLEVSGTLNNFEIYWFEAVYANNSWRWFEIVEARGKLQFTPTKSAWYLAAVQNEYTGPLGGPRMPYGGRYVPAGTVINGEAQKVSRVIWPFPGARWHYAAAGTFLAE
jgi:hypothetical protein